MIRNCFPFTQATTPEKRKKNCKSSPFNSLSRSLTHSHTQVGCVVYSLFSSQQLHTGQFPACPRRANPHVTMSLLSSSGRGQQSVPLGGLFHRGCRQGVSAKRSYYFFFYISVLANLQQLLYTTWRWHFHFFRAGTSAVRAVYCHRFIVEVIKEIYGRSKSSFESQKQNVGVLVPCMQVCVRPICSDS